MNKVGKIVANNAATGVLKNVTDDTIRKVVPTRAAMHQKAHDEIQNIPVIGDAIDVTQKASYLGRLKRMFKKKQMSNSNNFIAQP